MPQILVRNLDADLVAKLKQRAASHGRSLEAEARLALEAAVKPSREEWIAELDRLRAETKGRAFTPSEVLVREDRDSH